MKKLLLSMIGGLLLCQYTLQAQVTTWVNPFKSNSTNSAVAVDVEFDANGNSYTVGYFSNTVNFDFNGSGASVTSNGGRDIFILKNNANGSFAWVRTIGGTLDDEPTAVEVGSSIVAVVGTYKSTSVDFSGTGNSNNFLSSNGGTDIWVAAFNGSGTHQWSKSAGSTQNELVTDVAIDNSQNVFIAGSFTTTTNFFTATNTSPTPNGARDVFLCKFDVSGVFQYVKVIGGQGTDVSNKLYVTSNLVAIAADIGPGANTFAFDPGSGSANFGYSGPSSNSTNGIVTIFSSQTGQYQKTYHFTGNTSAVEVYSSGTVYFILGSFSGTVDINPGTGTNNITATGARDLFIARVTAFTSTPGYISHYTANGVGLSDKVFPLDFSAKEITSNDIDLNITGYFNGAGNFGGTSAADVQGVNTTNTCGFVARVNFNIAISPTFTYKYAYSLTNNTATTNARGNGVASFGSPDRVLVAGQYASSNNTPAIFYPGGTITHTMTGPNNIGFLQNIEACATPTTTAVANDYTTCAGTTVTLTASGATTYSWNTGSTATSFTVSPTTTTTYTVTGTNTGGCTKTDTVRIAVTPLPNVVGIAGDYTTCAGTQTTIGASGANTFSWNTGSTASSLNVSPTTTTTYTVTGTTNGCSKTDTVKITVTALPNTLAVSNKYSICLGQSAVLNGGGANSYSWSSGPTTASYTVTPTSTTTYTLTGTTNGCSKTDTAKITVNQLPSVVASANDYSLCDNQTVTVTGSGATTYSWSSGNTASTFIVTPSSTTTYTLTGTTNGCSKTDTVKLTVNSFTLSVSPPSASICAGSGNNAVFTASGASTYSWTGGPTTASYTVTPTTTTTYTVTATSAAGCTKTTTAVVNVSNAAVINVTPSNPTICTGGNGTTLLASGGNTYQWTGGPNTAVYSVNPTTTTTYTVTGTALGGCTGTTTVQVTVATTPTVTANASATTICDGSSATITGSGANTYSWSTAATTNAITVSPASATTYTVTGTNSSGCSATSTVTIAVNPMPDNSIFLNGNTITSNQPNATYKWYDCINKSVLLGETAQSYTPTSNGSYAVIVTRLGCTDTSVCAPIITVGIDEIGSTSYLNIYPNPAHTYVILENLTNNDITIEIADLTGKIVFSTLTSNKITTLHLDEFSNGVYFVKSYVSNTVNVNKLIISK